LNEKAEPTAELCPGGCGADVDFCECWVIEEEERDAAFVDEILSRGPGCYDRDRETWYFDDDWLISAQDGAGNRIVVYYETAADKVYEVPNEIADWELCVRISEGTVELVPWR
jgi:hypothetical protein